MWTVDSPTLWIKRSCRVHNDGNGRQTRGNEPSPFNARIEETPEEDHPPPEKKRQRTTSKNNLRKMAAPS